MRLVLIALLSIAFGQAATAQPLSGPALGRALASGSIDPSGFDFGALRYAPGQTAAFLAAQNGAQSAIATAYGKPTYQAVLDAGVCPTTNERLAVAGFDSALLSPDAAAWARNKAAAETAFARYAEIRDAILAGKRAPYPEFEPDQASMADATRATRPELKALFLHRTRDQLVRHALIAARAEGSYADGVGRTGIAWLGALLADESCASDVENAAWLKATLATVAWFDIKTYGQAADEAAWLIALHADGDPALQALVLDRIGPLAVTRQSNIGNFASLWDRVALHAGRPQRYGTQMHCLGKAWVPVEPIEDPTQLNVRRGWAGLPSEAAYERAGARLCGG